MTIKQVAISAAKKAGKHIVRLSKNEIRYRMKHSHDILAEADLLSERTIIAEIRKHFPGHSILAEESGQQQNNSRYRWIIDPLDGTINYSRKLDEYAISIALTHDKKIVFGLIYQPHLKRLYIAEAGKGANLNGKRIAVSKEQKLINMLAGTANTHNIPGRLKNLKILLNIGSKVRHVRIYGSSSLDMAKVASGQIDFIYKHEFHYWDFAAGILLIEQAGGMVTDFAGKPITENSKGIVASNGRIHKQILKLLNRKI